MRVGRGAQGEKKGEKKGENKGPYINNINNINNNRVALRLVSVCPFPWVQVMELLKRQKQERVTGVPHFLISAGGRPLSLGGAQPPEAFLEVNQKETNQKKTLCIRDAVGIGGGWDSDNVHTDAYTKARDYGPSHGSVVSHTTNLVVECFCSDGPSTSFSSDQEC
eukprot:1184454-Prorocentrum_minimum.AAC.4